MCGWKRRGVAAVCCPGGIVQENRPSFFKRTACYVVVKPRLLGAGCALFALNLLGALRIGAGVLQELLDDLLILFEQRLGA